MGVSPSEQVSALYKVCMVFCVMHVPSSAEVVAPVVVVESSSGWQPLLWHCSIVKPISLKPLLCYLALLSEA